MGVFYTIQYYARKKNKQMHYFVVQNYFSVYSKLNLVSHHPFLSPFIFYLLHLFSSMKSHYMTKYTLVCSKVSVKWHKEF